MKYWVTEIKAKSPIDGSMRAYGGPDVPGETIEEAQDYCENNGLGYCWVLGQLIMDIPCKEGTFEPDWDNATNFDEDEENED